MCGAKQLALTIAFLLIVSSNLQAQSRIAWVTSWQEASTLAQRHQRLVLVHFWSDHCPPCVKLERSVFSRPEVIRAVASNYIPLKVNVDQNAELARYFHVEQWPTDVLVTAQGVEVYRGTSPQDPNRYIATLDQVAAHARIGAPFSGSASTSVAATSRASDLLNRGSAFPVGTVTGTPPTNPVPSPAATQHRGFSPLGGQAPPMGIQVPTIQPRSAQPPAANPAARGGAFSTNPNVTGPSGAALPQAREQQVSFTPPNVGQGQPSSLMLPHGTNTFPQPTANQFVSSGLGAPAGGAASSAFVPVGSVGIQAPQGSDPQTMDGYCSVTLVEQEKWVKGDPKWGAVHRGRTYLFVGAEEQQRFLADFDKYAPALSGFDCVKYAEQGALVEGRRVHGVFYRGQIFLFADEAALQKFWGAPQRYVPIVQAEQDRQAARR